LCRAQWRLDPCFLRPFYQKTGEVGARAQFLVPELLPRLALAWKLPLAVGRKNLLEETKTMKRVCAWCGRELDPAEPSEDAEVTHGLCPACRNQFFPSTKAKEADSPSTQQDARDDPGRTGGHSSTE